MASSDLNSIETWNIFGANSLYMGNLTMDTNGDCNAHIVADNTDEKKAELLINWLCCYTKWETRNFRGQLIGAVLMCQLMI